MTAAPPPLEFASTLTLRECIVLNLMQRSTWLTVLVVLLGAGVIAAIPLVIPADLPDATERRRMVWLWASVIALIGVLSPLLRGVYGWLCDNSPSAVIRLDANGLCLTGPTFQTTYAWSDVRCAARTQRLILLKTTSADATIPLARRRLPEDWERWLDEALS